MEKIVDLLESPDNFRLVLEGTADVVDYEILSDGNLTVEVGQIKTKDEPRQWTPSELLPIFSAWITDRPSSSRYVFISNGSAGPEVKRLETITRVLNEGGALDSSSEEFLESKFNAIPLLDLKSLLSRTRILTRYTATSDLLTKLEYRLARLGVASPDESVTKLFTKVSLSSEHSELAKRTLHPKNVGELIGLEWPVVISPEERLHLYEKALSERLAAGGLIPLSYSLRQDDVGEGLLGGYVPVFRLVGGNHPKTVSVNELVVGESNVLIGGAPGSGKTTTLNEVAKKLISSDCTVVIGPAYLYRGESCEKFLGEQLARFDSRLGSNQLATWFRTRKFAVLFDGIDECPKHLEDELLHEIRWLARTYPNVRVIGSSRNPTHSTRLGFSYAEVLPLNESRVRSLLSLEENSGVITFSKLERSLGKFLFTPLAVQMALMILKAGRDLPVTRWGVYKLFTQVLFERDANRRRIPFSFELLYALSQRVALQLHELGMTSIEWFGFVDLCESFLADHRASGRYSLTVGSAEELAYHVSLSPWYRRDDTTISFAHQSLQEFLAAHGLDSGAMMSLATQSWWHEVVAFQVASLPPHESELTLEQLAAHDLAVVGVCWRTASNPPSLRADDYITKFGKSLERIVSRHIPDVIPGKHMSVAGTTLGSSVLYGVFARKGLRPVSTPDELVVNLRTGDYLRVMPCDRLLKLSPTLAAYREALDMLERRLKKSIYDCEPEDFTLRDIDLPSESEQAIRIQDFLSNANEVFDQLVRTICPTLELSVNRPGDVTGFMTQRNEEPAFSYYVGERGQGPVITASPSDQVHSNIFTVRVASFFKREERKFAIEHLRDELTRVLFGYGSSSRWRI